MRDTQKKKNGADTGVNVFVRPPGLYRCVLV